MNNISVFRFFFVSYLFLPNILKLFSDSYKLTYSVNYYLILNLFIYIITQYF